MLRLLFGSHLSQIGEKPQGEFLKRKLDALLSSKVIIECLAALSLRSRSDEINPFRNYFLRGKILTAVALAFL